MGACYSVTLNIKVKDEEKAILALQEKIKNDEKAENVNYCLALYAKEGATVDTFDGLMRIFLAGWKRCPFEKTVENGWITYSNDFDASYGWEDVMLKMFSTLIPFVEDESEIFIYPDSGTIHVGARDGKLVRFEQEEFCFGDLIFRIPSSACADVYLAAKNRAMEEVKNYAEKNGYDLDLSDVDDEEDEINEFCLDHDLVFDTNGLLISTSDEN